MADMSFLIILGLIILGLIILALALIGLIGFGMYAVSSGIANKNETEKSAWDYWETMKNKRWAELSEEEKRQMIIANMIIADDIGMVVTERQIEKMLEDQLPIMEPKVGLSYSVNYD